MGKAALSGNTTGANNAAFGKNALKVNTFDQPSVELIKKQTKKFLI